MMFADVPRAKSAVSLLKTEFASDVIKRLMSVFARNNPFSLKFAAVF